MQELHALAAKQAGSYPDSIRRLKKVFWEGTEICDNLLKVRAAISSELALSDFTKNVINAFKKK
jgi:methylglutaconyl-CoA hydratase